MRKTTALVRAGGINRGFSVLTHNRAKSAMPFCGHFRIIDFALSNLSLSGIDNVGVIIQYLPGSLIDHIGIGRAYDFDTTNRRIKLMPPFVGMGRTEWFRGTAEAVHQNLSFARDNNSDLVLILSGDHVYSMDYAPLIAFHRKSGAEVTVVTRKRPDDVSPRNFGYVTCKSNNQVTHFIEKPLEPPHDTISVGIYLFNANVLAERLEKLQEQAASHSLPTDVVEPLVRQGRKVYAYSFTGDWHYLANLEAYMATHRRLLCGQIELSPRNWHVMTDLRDRELGSRPSPYFGPASNVQDSMISPGCYVEGTVIRSVLSPGVYVAANAIVMDSILMHDCQVYDGAKLQSVVSDKDAVFYPHCHVGGSHEESFDRCPIVADLTVVGKGAQIMKGVRVGPGLEIPINMVVMSHLQASTPTSAVTATRQEA